MSDTLYSPWMDETVPTAVPALDFAHLEQPSRTATPSTPTSSRHDTLLTGTNRT